MKSTNPWYERPGNKVSFNSSVESLRGETVVLAGLGLAGIVAVVIAVVSGSVPKKPGEDSLADLQRIPIVKYVRSGQLAADVRTAMEVVHYFFEAEPTNAINERQEMSTQANLSRPTNTIQIEPKA